MNISVPTSYLNKCNGILEAFQASGQWLLPRRNHHPKLLNVILLLFLKFFHFCIFSFNIHFPSVYYFWVLCEWSHTVYMYSSWTCWVFWGFFPPSGSVSLQPSFFVFLNLFILLFNFIYLFILAVLGLCCCARAFL